MSATNTKQKQSNQKLITTNNAFDWLDDMQKNKNAIRLHRKKKNYKNKSSR